MRAALEDGAHEYRFLEGDEQYKYRFTNDDPGLETIGVARGTPGGAALAMISLAPPLARAGRYAVELLSARTRRKLG